MAQKELQGERVLELGLGAPEDCRKQNEGKAREEVLTEGRNSPAAFAAGGVCGRGC